MKQLTEKIEELESIRKELEFKQLVNKATIEAISKKNNPCIDSSERLQHIQELKRLEIEILREMKRSLQTQQYWNEIVTKELEDVVLDTNENRIRDPEEVILSKLSSKRSNSISAFVLLSLKPLLLSSHILLLVKCP